MKSNKQREPSLSTEPSRNCFVTHNAYGQQIDSTICHPVDCDEKNLIDEVIYVTTPASETEMEDIWITALNYDKIVTDDGDGADGDKDWVPDNDTDELIDDDDEVLGDEDVFVDDLYDEGNVVDLLKNEDKILKILNDYETEDLVFTDGELSDLKTKEQMLMERNNRGYYQCRHKHAVVYKKIMETLEPYLSDENLRQLFHPYHMRHNEALNKSVATYAPKHKIFSMTESLSTRVGIVAGLQILGYHYFWRRVFDYFNICFDNHLSNVLTKMQQKKSRQQVRSKTIEKTKKCVKIPESGRSAHPRYGRSTDKQPILFGSCCGPGCRKGRKTSYVFTNQEY